MEREVTVAIKRELVNPSAPPKPAHKFVYAKVGHEICLDVGHFDLAEVAKLVEEARKGGGTATVPLLVTERYCLSPDGALDMLKTAKALVDDLRKHGMLPPDGDAAEG